MSRKKVKKTIRRRKQKKRVRKTKKPSKLWGLEARTFSRGARHLMDQDYFDKLSPEEKQWLSDFNETYYGNKYPNKSTKGRKTNMFDKAGIPRKETYNATNARNRDIHATGYRINSDTTDITLNANGESTNLFDRNRESIEPAMIEWLDFNQRVEMYKKLGHEEAEAKAMATQDVCL